MNASTLTAPLGRTRSMVLDAASTTHCAPGPADPAHPWPGYRHACHYLSSTTDLRRRWPEHLAGGYDPATRKNTGPGSRLLAAALHAGCQVELVRVWYGAQARTLEQRLKQRRKPDTDSLRAGAARSLKPLCPVCNPAGWWRRYPDLPDPAPPPRPRRFVHDPELWDADAEWDLAFPHLAYSTPDVAAAAALQVGMRLEAHHGRWQAIQIAIAGLGFTTTAGERPRATSQPMPQLAAVLRRLSQPPGPAASDPTTRPGRGPQPPRGQQRGR